MVRGTRDQRVTRNEGGLAAYRRRREVRKPLKPQLERQSRLDLRMPARPSALSNST